MRKTRKPAVAGRFYPADAKALGEMVSRFLETRISNFPKPFAIISPHAGYIYSGCVAGKVYSLLREQRGIERVVILGPAHYVPLYGAAFSDAEFFETPLGLSPVDMKAGSKLLEFDFVEVNNEAHRQEHSLEVQLPFIQKCFEDVSIIPLVLGDISPEDVSKIIEALCDEDTLFVVSSDLSHYLSYEQAKEIDAETSRMIEALSFKDLLPERACGAKGINGLMCYAKRNGLSIKTVYLANSGDTAGPHDSVVGYGAYVCC